MLSTAVDVTGVESFRSMTKGDLIRLSPGLAIGLEPVLKASGPDTSERSNKDNI